MPFHDLADTPKPYPRAALFAFAVILCAYNVLAVIKAGIRATYGASAEPVVSGYRVANEVTGPPYVN